MPKPEYEHENFEYEDRLRKESICEVARRPSSAKIDQPPPSGTSDPAGVKPARVSLMSERVAMNLNIWTGEPLPEGESYDPAS